MKIAMIGQKGMPAIYGGIERHVEELAQELVKQGHEVLVYARKWYSPKKITRLNGVKIFYAPTIHTKHLDAIAHTFTATMRALWQKPDVIHYHGVGPSLLSWIPRVFLPGAKVITTTHCLDRYHQKWGRIARLFLRLGEWTAYKFAHQTIVVSKTMQNYYLNEYQKNTTFIPNGVRTCAIKNSAAIEDAWNLKANKYILMVSRLVKHKGAHYLLVAWQFARQQYPQLLKDCKLVVVGDANFTESYLQELRAIARGDKSIVFTGWQNGEILDELYANAALFVHPSENEGLPITVLQAMAHGKPALVSDIPEHQEVITDSQFWFNNANVSSLAAKIVELLQAPRLLLSTGEINKKIALNKYRWQEIAKKVVGAYNCKKNHGASTYSYSAA